MKKILKNKKFWLLLVGILLILYLLNHFGFKDIVSLCLEANGSLLLLSLLPCFLLLLVRGLKWHYYLVDFNSDQPAQSIHPLTSIKLYLINNMISTITPLRGGELYGPFLLNKRLGIPLGQGFFLIFVDRIYELAFLVIMLAISLWTLVNKDLFNEELRLSMLIIMLILIAAIIVLLILLQYEKLTRMVMDFFQRKIKNKKVSDFIDRSSKEFSVFYEFRKKYSSGFYIKQGVLTILGWLLLYVTNFMIVLAITQVDFLDAVLAQTISFGVGFISMIPAGIGSTTLGYVYVMELLGYENARMVAGSLLSKFFFVVSVYIGGYLALFFNRKPDVSE